MMKSVAATDEARGLVLGFLKFGDEMVWAEQPARIVLQ